MSKCMLNIEQSCEECRMCITKEVQISPERKQEYIELVEAVKRSGIALDLQEKILELLHKEYFK